MIEKDFALVIREHALKAIAELTQIMHVNHGQCSADEYERVKRGVGLSIGNIQTNLLDLICEVYPELDDLK